MGINQLLIFLLAFALCLINSTYFSIAVLLQRKFCCQMSGYICGLTRTVVSPFQTLWTCHGRALSHLYRYLTEMNRYVSTNSISSIPAQSSYELHGHTCMTNELHGHACMTNELHGHACMTWIAWACMYDKWIAWACMYDKWIAWACMYDKWIVWACMYDKWIAWACMYARVLG